MEHKTKFTEKVLEPIENMFHRAAESTVEHASEAARHAAHHAKEGLKEAGYKAAHKLPETVQEKLGVKREPLIPQTIFERAYDYFARSLFASPLVFIAAPLLIGLFVSNWVQNRVRANRNFFERVELPPWKPPAWLYDPMWTIALSCMGYASYKIYEQGRFGEWLALGFYGLNLALLIVWPFLFFGRFGNTQLISALCSTALLVNTLITTMIFATQSDSAALLMLPALVWIGYMCAVNWDVYNRNAGKFSLTKSVEDTAKGKEESWPWGGSQPGSASPQQPIAATGETKKVR
jgi:tryptophan-rich sensory protein